jgi:hypothetical protein
MYIHVSKCKNNLSSGWILCFKSCHLLSDVFHLCILKLFLVAGLDYYVTYVFIFCGSGFGLGFEIIITKCLIQNPCHKWQHGSSACYARRDGFPNACSFASPSSCLSAHVAVCPRCLTKCSTKVWWRHEAVNFWNSFYSFPLLPLYLSIYLCNLFCCSSGD